MAKEAVELLNRYNKTPHLLILGSKDEFVELVLSAHRRGIEVTVADGYADGAARAVADFSYTLDLDDRGALLNICKDRQIDAIVTAYSDILFEAACRFAYEASLPCSCPANSLEALRDKRVMKALFDALDIPTPYTLTCSLADLEKGTVPVPIPCVVKPVDGYGSYGITLVKSASEVFLAARQASAYSQRSDEVLIEEYDDGAEFNMMTWIDKGQVYLLSVARREKTPHVPGEVPLVSRIVYPARIPFEVSAQACQYAKRIAARLGLQRGPLCMQFFWSPQRGVRVGEVAGRVFGYEHTLLTLASGLAVEDLLLDTAFDSPALSARLAKHNPLAMPRCSCGVYFHAKEGCVGDTLPAKRAFEQSGVHSSKLYYREGQTIQRGDGAPPYAALATLVASQYAQIDEQSALLFSQFSLPDTKGYELAFKNELPCDLNLCAPAPPAQSLPERVLTADESFIPGAVSAAEVFPLRSAW